MNLILKITGKCVFNCVYCSASENRGGDMLMETLEKTLFSFADLLRKTGRKKASIIFHGGEPLSAGLEYFEKFMPKTPEIFSGLGVSFKVQTNGYLINEKWCEFFKKYEISPGVSIDGCRSIHDACRVLPDGSGTYDKVMKNISLLDAKGINHSSIAVFSPFFRGFETDFTDWLVESRMNMRVNPAMAMGSGASKNELVPRPEEYSDFLIFLYETLLKKNCDLCVNPITDFLDSTLKGAKMSECSLGNSCGSAFICVDHEGGIYPCGRFSDINAMKCGDISSTSLYEAYNSENMRSLRARAESDSRVECGGCAHMKRCSGGCAAVSFAANENIHSKNPLCEDYKKLFDYFRGAGLDMLKNSLIERKKVLREFITKNIDRENDTSNKITDGDEIAGDRP